MPSDQERKVVDFAQLRVTMLADTLRDLVEQMQFTNTHIARLTRDVGEMRSEMAQLRSEMQGRFGKLDRELLDVKGDLVLQANHILNAQQGARQALARIQDLLEDRAAGAQDE